MAQQKGDWLSWARELQALSQIGRTFAQNHYDRINYERLGEIAAEILACRTTLEPDQILDRFAIEPGYATAKIDVRGAVFREGRILLVRERKDGKWCMPGGWADVGDLPSAMVAREVWEESGFTVRAQRLVGVYDANRSPNAMEFFHAYKIVFLCDILKGEARPSHETSEVCFFHPNELPELSSFRTDMRHVRDAVACLRDPGHPAAFD